MYKKIFYDSSVATASEKCLNAIIQLVKEHTGLTAYKEQKKAAKQIFKGNIVDMKTGEGKSLVVLISLLMAAREGRKVYVVTSNDYLSERDYNYSKPILEDLGIKSVFLKSSVGGSSDTYKSNQVIYATGSTLIFDYLRGIKADYDFVIIDEIDYILVECANHDFSVSDGSEGMVQMPVDIFRMCKKIADIMTYTVRKGTDKKEDYLFDMQYEYDVVINYTANNLGITTAGYEKLRRMMGKFSENPLFLEILIATLYVKYLYIRDKHYIVSNGEIIIINDSNGRISINGSNDICIQTAIEVKENVEITAKALLHNTCSFPVFFSIFRTLTGLSGTASYVPFDFSLIYGKEVKKIKEHFRNRRKEIYKYFKTDSERIEEIIRISESEHNPILIVTDSDSRTGKIAEILAERTTNKHIEVLDNRVLSEEEELLQGIKRTDAVLISGKIVGRGTDIDLPESFEEGLTVIVAQRFLSERAERQVIGRTGRNGRKGTCYVLTSEDDTIFHLAYAGKKKLSPRYIRKLQARYEQKMFDTRKHIYIRSKLFFDQDCAIKDKLAGFNVYGEMLDFVRSCDIPNEKLKLDTIRLIKKAIGYGFVFTPHHNGILLHTYSKIRPVFQQQFLQYNDNMAATLYQTDTFNDRCFEYVRNGRTILVETIYEMLKPIVKAKEDEIHRIKSSAQDMR